jgi:hypothetical protein
MPTSLETHEIIALHDLRKTLLLFQEEVQLVLETLVLPNWSGRLHGMTNILYGAMMRSFSLFDLLSILDTGSDAESQTIRMTHFLANRADIGTEEAEIAVRIWRHQLMHTAAPRPILIRGEETRYEWLLHWGHPHLPREQHFRFHVHEHRKILGIGLQYLIEDLISAFEDFERDLTADLDAQARFRSGREIVKWREITGLVAGSTE